MTILEVLFSILVTSVGLLGAIALFPVASTQARRARTLDAAAASAHSAVHMFDTLGMRRPDRWWGNSGQWDAPIPPTVQTNGWWRVQDIRFVPGTAFCIDPRTVAANSGNPQFPGTASGNSPLASLFPHVLRTVSFPFMAGSPRMFRISLISGSNSPPSTIMGQLQADGIFIFNDDLAFFRPGLDDVSTLGIPGITNDRSLPAFQDFTRYPTHRLTQGRLSWIATLVPKIDVYSVAGNINARGFSAPTSDEYLLSIVIIADRPSDLDVTDPNHERLVNAIVQGDGSTGGEVLLTWTPTSGGQSTQNETLAKDQLKVRSNEWIMLAALQVYRPVAGQPAAIPRFQWYRVTDVDDIVWDSSAAAYTRFVTLTGQDWDTNYVLPNFPNDTNRAEATLIEGVVAVYEKTIRLDYGSTY